MARAGSGQCIDSIWVFVLDDVGNGRSNLVFRCRGIAAPRWLRALFTALIIPADYVMSRQMLTGIKERVASQKVRDQVNTLAAAIHHGGWTVAW